MKRIITIVSATLFLLVIFTGCSTTQNNSSTKGIKETNKPIKVGWIGPLSGDVANLGENVRDAVKVAQDEINEQGGIYGQQLEIIFEDGMCDGKGGANAANKLINIDKVDVILGGICSGETLAAAPLAEESNVLLFSAASTNPKITDAGDYVFRIIPSDSFQGTFIADYIINTLNKKNVAIIYNDDIEWSVGVKNVFKKRFLELGGNIVSEEGANSESRDVRSQLTKIKQSGGDIIFAPTYRDSGVIILKQKQNLGIDLPILGGDVWDDMTIAQNGGMAANGAMFSVATKAELPTNFKIGMKAETGTNEINTYAPRAYDALHILADIMNRVGTNGDEIKNELYNLRDYKGIADTYTLDKNGDMENASYNVFQFQDGEMVKVY
ncbi:ABC transporter substrate-binding protein [Candidatus Parcubacteria bacterium]|jgi:branched-chain amino acid transport system substrate-binding protein|nr:ABC transporter substrate-binding protein [Candidatus Parcubacteria bacterium]MBT3949270.1 ABC transporter substrate-binding protein [Candidatus Parcubacteria bacterium]